MPRSLEAAGGLAIRSFIRDVSVRPRIDRCNACSQLEVRNVVVAGTRGASTLEKQARWSAQGVKR